MGEEKKLVWMYSGLSGLVDKEDYLTGRKVDKTFELMKKEEEQAKGHFNVETEIPASILKQASGKTVTVDVQAKLREDPLYEIKRKQIEQRKEIINNPMKMKRIRQMLESTLSKDGDKKKKSKKKKRRRSRSSSSDSDSDSDSESDRRRRRAEKPRKERDDGKKKRDTGRRSRSRDRSERRDRDRKKDRSREKDRDSDKYRESNRNRDKDKGQRKERTREEPLRGERDERNDKKAAPHHHPLPSPSLPVSASSSVPLVSKLIPNRRAPKPKLSAEELEKKRMEMMRDAKWRDREREERIRNIQETEKAEKEVDKEGKGAQFIKPLLEKAVESDSLSKRVRQKMFSVQRNHHSMDTNFARK